jgi:hypothetical protein
MDFSDAPDLFERPLKRERHRPSVHATILSLAMPDTITGVSAQSQKALARRECGFRKMTDRQRPIAAPLYGRIRPQPVIRKDV